MKKSPIALLVLVIYISLTYAAQPKGYLDKVDCNYLSGWACDSDDFSKPLEIHFYDGKLGNGGKFIGATIANNSREDLFNVCGGKINHGFNFPTPRKVLDKKTHFIYAYAIDDKKKETNPLLAGSPLPLKCNYPKCIEKDWWADYSPEFCRENGTQTRNWRKINKCEGGVNHPASEEVSCNPGEGVKIVGEEEIVYDWSKDNCKIGNRNDPDYHVQVFKDKDNNIQLILSNPSSTRLIGPDFNNLKHVCNPIMWSGYSQDPSTFENEEWIDSLYTEDGKIIYATIHNEYVGKECPVTAEGAHFKCWYNSVTFAQSNDGGKSYVHPAPPNHLLASLPYEYEAGKGPFGVFSFKIIKNLKDNYFYALMSIFEKGTNRPKVCLARTNNISDPKSWRAWNGKNFTIKINRNPYKEDINETEENCTGILKDGFAMSGSITYNTYLGKFLLIDSAMAYDPLRQEYRSAVYYTTSDNLINWSHPKLLLDRKTIWDWKNGDQWAITYPTLIDHNSPSRNFDISGKTAYLYYVKNNYDRNKSTSFLDRDLFRVKIEFYKNEEFYKNSQAPIKKLGVYPPILIKRPICTKFNYSEWGECQINDIMERKIISAFPAGCVGGEPYIQKKCKYIPKVGILSKVLCRIAHPINEENYRKCKIKREIARQLKNKF